MYDTFPIKHQCHFFDFGRKYRGRDRMVVGFTTTNAISTYHKYREFDSSSWCGEFDTTLCDKSLSVTCNRSVVISGYSDFIHQ